MRNSFFYLALFLVGCGNNGDQSLVPANLLPRDQHIPEITELTMSPDSAMLMDGGGDIVVSVEVSFLDAGQDIQNLWIRMPDGTHQNFPEALNTATGTFTQRFLLSTEMFGEFEVEFWLRDRAGSNSDRVSTSFHVFEETDWTNRLSGLPFMWDVTWDGDVFIAVGSEGTILTSVDGIDWAAIDSGVDDDLYAVAAHGLDIFAVGSGVVLRSMDHGENWITVDMPIDVNLMAVTLTPTKVVSVGTDANEFVPLVILSGDRGDTWEVVDSLPSDTFNFTDLTYWDGLFVATADTYFSFDGGRVFVSADGAVWNELVDEEDAGLLTVTPAGNQLIVGGRFSTVLASFDGLNWTELQTPDVDADYESSAWNGSRIVLAGKASEFNIIFGSFPPEYVPVGVSSMDGGATWETFNIAGYYWSMGLAWGNGRFVSVGWQPMSEEGAIYTTE